MPQATQLKKRTVVLIKTEVNPGFDSGPVEGVDAILMEDVTVSPADANMLERNPSGATLGKAKSSWAGNLWQISGKVELKGSGVATTPPEIAPILKGAGLAETVGASNVQYATSSVLANAKHFTAYVNLDGVQYVLTGTLPSDIGGNLDGSGTIDVTLVGHGVEWGYATAGAASTITLAAEHTATDSLYVGRKIKITRGPGEGEEKTITDYVGSTKVATVDTAWTTVPTSASVYAIEGCPMDVALYTPTYDSTVAPPYIAAPFAYGSYAAVISTLSFSLGLQLSRPKNPASPDGFGTLTITGRAISGSFDPQADSVANMNWEDAWRNRTEQTIDTGTVGYPTNQYQFQFLRSAIGEPGRSDRDGINTREISFESDGHVSDGEFVATFS